MSVLLWLLLLQGSACPQDASPVRHAFIVSGDPQYLAERAPDPGKLDPLSEEANSRFIELIRSLSGAEIPKSCGGGRVSREILGVLVTGDLIDSGDKPGHRYTAMQRFEWARFKADYGLTGKDGGLPYPIYELHGNHDGPQGDTFIVDDIIERNRTRPNVVGISPNGLHYSWDWGPLHLINLGMFVGPGEDRRKGHHYAPRSSLEFLRADLEKHVGASGRPVILSFHLHPNGPEFDWPAEDLDALFAIARDHNVIAMFHGHSHRSPPSRLQWNGTRFASRLPRGLDVFNPDDSGAAKMDHKKGQAVGIKHGFLYVELVDRVGDEDDVLIVRSVSTTDNWATHHWDQAWTKPVRISAPATPNDADVIVYGSTPGGFCAAIAAAREGASVILLEPTDHVGGLNTGGLSHSDSNQTIRSTVMGLFDEWHRRIESDYATRGIELPYDVDVKDHAIWTYEPHVAARVTRQMLDEANVTVLTGRSLQSATKDGVRITSLNTDKGVYSARTFVDGTYEGDLMAAAGIGWTIGREGKKEFGESLAGKRYPKPRMMISGLRDDGGLLPLITTTDAGPEEEGDANVMVYSFRLCLTADPENRVPFPEPSDYDPARFEVMRRYARSGDRRLGWDLYPLPGDKFDGNNSIGGQFSLGLVGACNGWSEADATARASIWEAHKQYTLEFYRFLTTDPAVPEKIRKKFSRLGLCKDEFAKHGHFPPALYVREGRRMKGMYILSQRDILDDPRKTDPIAVSSFPIDSHDCQRVAVKGSVVNEGTIFPVRMKGRRHGFPYHVPYRAILPKPDECSNLLVPVALSSTHVALSSVRVEPTWMVLGQSAGIAAALAAGEGTTVQELPYGKLRRRLLARKQVLELPRLAEGPAPAARRGILDPAALPGIVLDDDAAEADGSWKRSSRFKPHVGPRYLHDDNANKGRSTLTFKTTVSATGRYDIRLAYSPHASRASNLPMTVSIAGKHHVISIDQRLPLDSTTAFRTITTLQLEKGREVRIQFSNKGTDGFVVIDAIQIAETTKRQ